MSEVNSLGYGSRDLIEELRNAEWSPCVPEGKNFDAIDLGGYCLAVPKDSLCPKKLMVVVRDKTTQETFIVKGYCFSSALTAVEVGEPTWGPIKFMGHQLTEHPKGDDDRAFAVSVVDID